MFKIKAARYVEICHNVMARKTKYRNRYPYNCGYYDGEYLYGDCWCFNPKSIMWAESIGKPIDKHYTVGKEAVDERYFKGIEASGIGDYTGDAIMARYCEKVSFANLLKKKQAPALLLITGIHMGAYIGDFVKSGRTYNVCEFTPNSYLGDGLCPSYVDATGGRYTHKGGILLGYWNTAGYPTAFVDYSAASEGTDSSGAAVQKPWSIDNVAVHIMRGKLPDGTEVPNGIDARKAFFGQYGYGADEVQQAQDIVNEVYARNKRDVHVLEIAMKLIAGEGGDGVTLRRQWVADTYGDESLFDEAQKKVNAYLA